MTPETDGLAMWMGQNVDDMTQEQAIAALKQCIRMLNETMKMHIADADMRREIREARNQRNAA